MIQPISGGVAHDLPPDLRKVLTSDPKAARKAANEALRRATPDSMSLEAGGRMVWTMRSLMDFMYMEIVTAADNGARLGSCKRCGSFFFTAKAHTGEKPRNGAALPAVRAVFEQLNPNAKGDNMSVRKRKWQTASG